MTTTTTTLPHPKAVRDMLEELLGRDVEVAPATEPLSPGPDEPVTVAVFVDDSLHTAAVGVFDLSLSAIAGAAIGVMPRGLALDCVEERELTPMLRDNLYEVLNIASALFNLPGHPHTRLYAVHGLGEAPPTDISALTHSIGARLDLTVTVGGYGHGRLSFVV